MKTNWRTTFDNMIGSFVDATWIAMLRDPAMRRVCFYYTRTDGLAWGQFHAVLDGDSAPIGAELVTAEYIPAGTQAQIRHFIGRFTGQLPMIPAGV